VTDYEWNPDTYLRTMHAEIPGYEELQDAVAAASSGRNVLELGTGTGETALRVLARNPGAQWTGIDASEAMLAQARQP
jgi:trans-aconitate methyltransferase